ncbi:DUF898 domain-containing protein [Rheinheimera riviphila]|uniref:DUF898 domain-containing protein n=1 Tax=Rheinheimera riviphila TaxID=1834037 RepID=A0A437QFI7_9GAMM|nr:YjgN family protein [Rheinheimera riviphila]RVU33282.1 DUF898 domain-containing protein [Rheinheimera riviphila]
MDNTIPAVSKARSGRINFSGQGGEFFGIWIVNILLSIVTLGIYSAWAKVRTTQYFYGHTKVDGHAFRYLATPMQILKGRLLAILVFLVVSVLSNLFPLFAIFAAVALLFVMPWLLIMGLRFNLRMTSYRNIRFGFNGSYGEAMLYFMLLPFLSLFTLYLALPYAMKKLDQFVFSNITYGGKSFVVNTETGTYYQAVFMAILVTLGLAAIGFMLSYAISPLIEGDIKTNPLLMLPLFAAYFVVFTLAGAVYQAIIRNHLFNSTELPELANFKSDVPTGKLFVVSLTNLLAIVCSLGLAYPWTTIRMSRLLAEHTEVTVQPALDLMRDQLAAESSAFAEDAAGLYDADFSLT